MDMKPIGLHQMSTYTAPPAILSGAKEAAPAAPKDQVSIGNAAAADDKPGALRKAFNSMVSGVGLGSGAIGGGLLGASLAGAGTVVEGLLASNFTWAAVGAAGVTGGIVGAALLGIAGAYGGWKVAEGIGSGIKWVGNKIFQGKKFAELQKKEELLKDQESKLKQAATDLTKETEKAKQYHETKAKELDAREESLNGRDATLTQKEQNLDKIIDEKSDAMYQAKSADLREWEGKLTNREADLTKWDKEISQREKDVNIHIENGAQSLYDKRKVVLESEYQARHSKLDTRESELKKKEDNVEYIIQDRVEKKLKPLQSEWQLKLDNAQRYEDQAADKLRLADNELRTAQNNRQQAEMYKNDAYRERQEARSERERYTQLNAQVQGEKAQVESDKRRLMQKEAQLNRWEQELRDREAQLNKR